MKLIELEVHCPECAGTVVWTEQQVIGRCEYCGSLLYFEPDLEHRFYLEPRVRSTLELVQVLALWKAERERADVVASYRSGDENDLIAALAADVDLAPFIRKFEAVIHIKRMSMIFVPYWHFQATLFQSLLAVNEHGTKEYSLRRLAVDQALPAYDSDRWNFRDRGLRFKKARFKEVTRDLLATNPHLKFSFDSAAAFETILRTHAPAKPATMRLLNHNTFCECRKVPVLRPYWIVDYDCRGTETVLVDACFGTVAGHPDSGEADRLYGYKDKPHVPAASPALKVISSRCPVCGVDINWGPLEKVHFCENCGRALALSSGDVAVQPFEYAAAEDDPSIVLPFWRFRVHMAHRGKQYSDLSDYYKLFFNNRLLKGRTFSNFLCIPAVRIREIDRGDELLSALIASASAARGPLSEGPMQPLRPVRPGDLDLAAATEILNCALPAASGVAPALHKLGDLKQMLKETALTIDQARLVVLPFPLHGGDMVVESKSYSVALLDPA